MNQPEKSSVSYGVFFSVLAALFLCAAVGGYFVWDAMDGLSLQNRELERSQNSLQSEKRDLERKLTGAESKNASLEREKTELSKQAASAGEGVSAVRQELAAAKSAAEDARRELEKLQSAPPPAQAAIAPQDNCAGLAGELEDARAQNAELTAKLQAAAAGPEALPAGQPKECAALRDQNADLAARLESAQTLAADAAAKAETCQASLDALRGEREQEARETKSAYDKIIANLEQELQNKDIAITRIKERLELTMLDGVLFRFGSSRITAKGQQILASVAGQLSNAGERRIYVVGHTDDVPVRSDFFGTFRNNWQLSADRAAAVATFLSKKSGLPPSQFSIVGRAFYQPVAPNDTPEGRARNRRVEIVIGDLDL